MSEQLTGAVLAKAIRLFLDKAYEGTTVPEGRRQFVDLDASAPVESILALAGVQAHKDASLNRVTGYSLRVGNAWYQHMKVQVSLLEGGAVIFGVDTHDRFDVPAGSPDADGVRALQDRNNRLAHQVERIWEREGIPTQAGLLRHYLADSQGGKRTRADSENPSA